MTPDIIAIRRPKGFSSVSIFVHEADSTEDLIRRAASQLSLGGSFRITYKTCNTVEIWNAFLVCAWYGSLGGGDPLFRQLGFRARSLGADFNEEKGPEPRMSFESPIERGEDCLIMEYRSHRTLRFFIIGPCVFFCSCYADRILIALPAIARWYLRCLYLSFYTINLLNLTGWFVKVKWRHKPKESRKLGWKTSSR